MKYVVFFVSFLLAIVHAQEHRTWTVDGQKIPYLATTNRSDGSFQFPGMRAIVVVADSGMPLKEIYLADSLRTMPLKNSIQESTCFYYINFNTLNHKLPEFIEAVYNQDLIDRNRLYLVFKTSADTASLFSPMLVSMAYCQNCPSPASVSESYVWKDCVNHRTSVQYSIATFEEMAQKQQENKQQQDLASIGNRRYSMGIGLTSGYANIGKGYRTATPDTVTKVDFTKSKVIYNISSYFYFTNRIYLTAEMMMLNAKRTQQVDSIVTNSNGDITVSGTGSGGAILRYGAGIGAVVWQRGRLSCDLGVTAGKMRAIAAGGSATRVLGGGSGSQNQITTQTETTTYYLASAGISYFPVKYFFLTTNIGYNISTFDNPIGSINGFRGASANIGLGFNFSFKN